MPTPDTPAPPHVLMVVGNDIRHDTRVLKSALALADGGLRVTVLGLSPTGRREETQLGSVRMIRVPVAWRLRDRRARAMKSRRQRHVSFSVTPTDAKLLDLEANVRARELAELGGRARRWRVQLASTKREAARVRNGLDRRVGKLETGTRSVLARWLEQRTLGASWRRHLPEVDDYDLAYTPVIDKLDWDILHAHDVHHVGTAARAVARRRGSGRSAQWVYDAHEYVAGLPIYPPRTKRIIAAWLDLEQEFIADAAAVITVTDGLAEQLRTQYSLPGTPTVVMNAPVISEAVPADGPGVREACGLAPGVPLVVYSGGVTPARGVHTVVEALTHLPGVHLAVVCVPHARTGPVEALRELATRLGVLDRVHFLDPVAPQEVSAFLASADLGVHPMVHFGSHEFALPNKLFEYLCGGLPLVVSDCRALAAFVRDNEVGSVFVAEDARDCARAVGDVLARRESLRARIAGDGALLEPYSWEHQAATLRDLYRDRLGVDVTEPQRETSLREVAERPVPRDDRPSVLGIGPANMAGQAWAWGRSVERRIPGARAHVMVVDRGLPLMFPADEIVPVTTYRTDARWAQTFEARAVEQWTHALLEAGRPLFGLRHGTDFAGDAEVLRGVGIEVGLLLHGSEARDPRRHAATSRWSPFLDPDDELTSRLQRQRDALMPKIDAFRRRGDGPVFVSTPDLLDDVPGAVLLPVVVDVDAWVAPAGAPPPLERDIPVVMHAPSRASLKGSPHVSAALGPLVAEGLVHYRHIEDVSPADMPATLHEADILVDQMSLGIYGVAAVEGLAAGRVVVSHVSDVVRERACHLAGRPLPVIEAVPDTLEATLRRIIADRDEARGTAADGAAFARELHDGRRSAQVLAEHFHLRG